MFQIYNLPDEVLSGKTLRSPRSCKRERIDTVGSNCLLKIFLLYLFLSSLVSLLWGIKFLRISKIFRASKHASRNILSSLDPEILSSSLMWSYSSLFLVFNFHVLFITAKLPNFCSWVLCFVGCFQNRKKKCLYFYNS